jgi:hypothetical protein
MQDLLLPFVITKLTNFEGGVYFYGGTQFRSTADENTLSLPLLEILILDLLNLMI